MMTEKEVKEKIKGANAVLEALAKKNCEPTSRLLPDGDDQTEWSASVACEDTDGNEATLTAYYYTDDYDAQMVEDNGGDWGGVDWQIDHYDLT